MINFNWLDLHNLGSSWRLSCCHENSSEVVDDLHGAEDGEAGEEPHGAPDHPQLRLQGHLSVLLYLSVGCSIKEDLNHLGVVADCTVWKYEWTRSNSVVKNTY